MAIWEKAMILLIEIPINFSLLTTPIKDTPSISKTSIISKFDNYTDKSYDKAAKIQQYN